LIKHPKEDDERAQRALEQAIGHCTDVPHRTAMLILVIIKASDKLALLHGTQQAVGVLGGVKDMLQDMPPIPPPGVH